jgi:MFS family permease
MDGRNRWLALIVLCLGTLMIVLDTTIVNVALPSIRTDLGFSQTSLAWVVNAYLLTFGGFLLLGGRLGDLYGHRRCSSPASRCSRSRRSAAVSQIRRDSSRRRGQSRASAVR